MTVTDAPEPLLLIKNLSAYYNSGEQKVSAVSGLSLAIESGQTVAIMGESGSGKTSVALALVNALASNGGWDADLIMYQGKEISKAQLTRLRGKKITYVMQDPTGALNPVMTIGDQIRRVLKYNTALTAQEREVRTIELLERVEIPDAASRLKAYPHEFSGGMQQRVVLAMALAPDPALLIADEPTTGLDVTVEAQIFALLDKLKQASNLAILLVSHDLGVVATSADAAIVLYAGKVVEQGSVRLMFTQPRHPYTIGLLQSARALLDRNTLNPIPGRVPGLGERPSGCVFHPRCMWKTDECESREPELKTVGDQRVACIHHEQVFKTLAQ